MSSAVPRTSPKAKEPFRTLELAATASYDAAALARVQSRAVARNRVGADAVRLYGATSDASGTTNNDERVRFTWRVWWAPPTLWRDDLTWPNGETTVIIVRPDDALAYVSMQRTLYTSEPASAGASATARAPDGMHLPTVADRLVEFPLLRPPLPASEWTLATLDQEVYLGRVVRRVRATRRADATSAEGPQPSRFWPGVDEYECLVDDSLGISLSITGAVDGVPAATIAADAIRVDVPFPADVFAFLPPAGTRIAHIARSA
jgi:hypothetical protein